LTDRSGRLGGQPGAAQRTNERAEEGVFGEGAELVNAGAFFQFRQERSNGQENVRQENVRQEDGVLGRRWIGGPPFTLGRVEEEEAYCQAAEAGRRLRRSQKYDTYVYQPGSRASMWFLGHWDGMMHDDRQMSKE
jgi:hypothetical protein